MATGDLDGESVTTTSKGEDVGNLLGNALDGLVLGAQRYDTGALVRSLPTRATFASAGCKVISCK